MVLYYKYTPILTTNLNTSEPLSGTKGRNYRLTAFSASIILT